MKKLAISQNPVKFFDLLDPIFLPRHLVDYFYVIFFSDNKVVTTTYENRQSRMTNLLSIVVVKNVLSCKEGFLDK